MTFGTGHVASPEAEAERIRNRPISRLLTLGMFPAPNEIDRRDIAGPVTSQLLNDCCWEAVGNALEITGRATGVVLPKLSRKQPYVFAQLRDQERRGVPFVERRARNVGTRIDMGCLALREHGIASEARCPYEPGDNVAQPDGELRLDVPLDVDIAASVAMLTGDFGVDPADAFDALSQAMLESHFGIIAIDVDDAFFDVHGPDCEYDGATGPIVGGHAVAAVGFRSAVGSSPAALLIKNSYGTGWGDGGYAWLTRNAVARGRDAAVFTAVPMVRA